MQQENAIIKLIKKQERTITRIAVAQEAQKVSIQNLDEKHSHLSEIVDRVIVKLVDMDQYMHENLATKDALKEVETHLTSHIDGFAQRQQKFDHELTVMGFRIDRLEGGFSATQ